MAETEGKGPEVEAGGVTGVDVFVFSFDVLSDITGLSDTVVEGLCDGGVEDLCDGVVKGDVNGLCDSVVEGLWDSGVEGLLDNDAEDVWVGDVVDLWDCIVVEGVVVDSITGTPVSVPWVVSSIYIYKK